MADPFYSSQWNPIRHVYYPQVQTQPRSTKPTLVNIPVHFVGSDDAGRKQRPAQSTFPTVPERNLRVPAAITIQQAVRGFLVRKNMRLVRQIAAEAATVERKVRGDDAGVLLDPRERLRVSEELMSLLLRLDSVRGVRDFRKKVIRRVIRLQEAIDANSDAADCNTSVIDVAERECSTAGTTEELPTVYDQILELQETEKAEVELEKQNPAPEGRSDLIVEGDETFSKHRVRDGQEESESRAEDPSTDNWKERDRSVDFDVEMNPVESKLEDEFRTSFETPKGESDMIAVGSVRDGTRPIETVEREGEEKGPSKEERGLRQMIERMVVENERLKLIVAQLCETSAEQCRLVEGLVDRINNLERLAYRKDRRKKRRSAAAYSALSSA